MQIRDEDYIWVNVDTQLHQDLDSKFACCFWFCEHDGEQNNKFGQIFSCAGESAEKKNHHFPHLHSSSSLLLLLLSLYEATNYSLALFAQG